MLKNILVFLAVLVAVHAVQVTVEVQMTNLAPQNGANLTPLWIGFHDGTFDTFDFGGRASASVERLAEDGDTVFISDDFHAADNQFIDSTIVADNSEVPIVQFGQTATQQFTIDSDIHKYVSLLSMVVPSNDAFVGNSNPRAYSIFDDDDFQSLTVMWMGDDVYDAGTEVNDEVPANTAFFGQMLPNSGVTENNSIRDHPGLLPPGSGGIVDDPSFVNADFSENGYVLGRVTIRLISGGNYEDDDDNTSNNNNNDDDDNDSSDDDSSDATKVSVMASVFMMVLLFTLI